MKNSCEDIFLKTEAFHNKNSHIVHSCICIAPHPGLLFPFSPFLKAESYLRDLNGGRYTLPINNEEKQRKTKGKMDIETLFGRITHIILRYVAG